MEIHVVWDRWKRVGKKIGDFQARALLTLFYFILLAPFALVIRRWSDPLSIKPAAPHGWRPRVDHDATSLSEAIKQF